MSKLENELKADIRKFALAYYPSNVPQPVCPFCGAAGQRHYNLHPWYIPHLSTCIVNKIWETSKMEVDDDPAKYYYTYCKNCKGQIKQDEIIVHCEPDYKEEHSFCSFVCLATWSLNKHMKDK